MTRAKLLLSRHVMRQLVGCVGLQMCLVIPMCAVGKLKALHQENIISLENGLEIA